MENQEEFNSLKEQVDIHKTRLHILETQKAGFGSLHCPPHIFFEIKEEKDEIERLTREIGRLEQPEPQSVKNKEPQDTLSMLVVISAPVAASDGINPPGHKLDVWCEWQNISDAVRISENQYHQVNVTRLFPPTRQMLEKTLLNQSYDILHFIGHGTEDGLVIEDEHGREEIVKIADIKHIFSSKNIKSLVILNACHSSGLGESLSGYIPSLVTTTDTISDKDAKTFTNSFYPKLFAGLPINEALNLAKKNLNNPRILQLIGKGDLTLKAPIISRQPNISFGEPRHNDLAYPLEFIGQSRRLVEIAGELEKAENRAIILSGIGGIGKTYLAQMAARRNAWRFPEGVVWFDTTEETIAQQILETISGFFNIKPEAVVGYLNINPCLLIIDNVEIMNPTEQEKLSKFLNRFDIRQGTKCILTSRRHIPCFEEMNATVIYPVRDFKEAEELLLYEAEIQGIVKEIEIHKDEFIRHTRNHPFLINKSVKMAKNNGVELVLHNLKSLQGEEVEKAVNDFIGKMIKLLNNEARELLKNLTIFVGSFNYSAIKAICGVESLDQITNNSVLDYDFVTYRYSFHQLVLDYIKQTLPLLSSKEEEGITVKFAKHYLRVSQDSSDPWQEIERDEPNIRKAVDWVAEKIENGEREREIVDLSCNYAFALKNYIYRRSIQEGLRWFLAGVVACQELGEKGDEANLYNEIGLRYYSQCNYSEALKWYERSIKIKEDLGDRAGLAKTYNNIGEIHRAQGNYPEALKWFERSIKIKEDLGDRARLATTYNNVGLIHNAQGNYPETLVWYERSIKISEEFGDRVGLAATYNNIGLIHKSQGNYPEALKWFERSIKIKEQIGDRAGLARTYNNIGEIHYARSNYPEALNWYERSKEILEQIGDRYHLSLSLYNIGLLYRDTSKKDWAKQYLKQSYQLYLQLGLKSEAGDVQQVLASL